MRMRGCLDAAIDVIEDCEFLLSDRTLLRDGMDYLKCADIRRHPSWEKFRDGLAAKPGQRLVLLTTRGSMAYTDFTFQASDTLLVGRESAGAPEAVHEAADARLVIPLKPGLRSLNVAQAAAMVLGE